MSDPFGVPTAWFVGVLAFVAMEPITAATHRWVMHGVAERLHRSHHRVGRRPGWESNDWFPVVFAAIVNLAFVAGFNVEGFGLLVPAAIGVTLYGAAYGYVHDVVIHGRLARLPRPDSAVVDHLVEAHRIHHLYGAAPYGMLVPVVPADLRRRAVASDRDPFART